MEPSERSDQTPGATVKRLYRSRTERHIGGVSGGVAAYANTDPTLVRVLFVVLAVMGPGLLLYPLLWAVIPEEPAPPAGLTQDPPAHRPAASPA
jgi:phage shock protein C